MFHNEIESRVSQTSASPPADDGTARVAVSASLLVVIKKCLCCRLLKTITSIYDRL